MIRISFTLCWMLLCLLVGCQKFSLRSQTPDDDDDEEVAKTVYIGDQVTVSGLHSIQIEGVGLVTNLNNTGGDSPPSLYRTLLLNDMKKRQVPNPNALLQSPTTSLVLIRAALPPTIQVGDKFDLEIVIPDNTEATSLAGGWLMECQLAEQAIVPGRAPLSGHILANARGPILLSTGEGDSTSRAAGLKRGRILGGGTYIGGINHKDRKLGLYLRNEFKNTRQTQRVAERIGRRFYSHEKGIKKSLAKATTDQHIELTVHPLYKQNYVRFIHVCRSIALAETTVEEHERMQRLKKSLMVPQTASKSALELEAIGSESIPILKEGLHSPIAEVRFYSADALAYLGSNAGAVELAAAAKNEEAFRVYALAALSILDDGSTHELLRELMNDPSAETRYGAFHAMHTLDKNDPFLRGEKVNDHFHLHVLRSQGEPMAHLTRYRTPEVVIFGAEQQLFTPLALSAGRYIVINAPSGSETATVSRFEPGKPDAQRVVSLRLADIVRTIGELGGSYPDVAQMLTQAERQSNLAGRLMFDALPQSGRIYHRPTTEVAAGKNAKATVTSASEARIGRPAFTPNLFPSLKSDHANRGKEDVEVTLEEQTDPGTASLSEPVEDEESQPGFWSKVFRNPFQSSKVE